MTDQERHDRNQGALVVDLAGPAGAAVDPGVVWKLTGDERQMDVNLVHLPAGAEVGAHVNRAVDVALVGVAGAATVQSGDQTLRLAAAVLIWLPRGTRRAITAGPQGASYLSIHRRRPGLAIGRSASPGDGVV